MKKILFPVVLSGLFLSGCASLFDGSTQYAMIATLDDQNRMETRCKIQNEEGSWNSPPYENIMIHKDGNPSIIVCENSKQIGKTQSEPEFSYGWLTLNLISDLCIFSCVIDGYHNALYRYPDRINVVMRDK